MTNPTQNNWSDIMEQYYTATTFLVNQNISLFPLDLFGIAVKNDWVIVPYQIAAQTMFTSIDELKHIYGNRGFVFYCCTTKQYIIAYNPQNSYEHIRFTIAHEIGHIILGHMSPQLSLTVEQKNRNEVVCNAFARCLLCPFVAIHAIKCFSVSKIQSIFNIGFTEADIALKGYFKLINSGNFLKNSYEKILYEVIKNNT